MFDKHDTLKCPLVASTPTKNAGSTIERLYCNTCEVSVDVSSSRSQLLGVELVRVGIPLGRVVYLVLLYD